MKFQSNWWKPSTMSSPLPTTSISAGPPQSFAKQEAGNPSARAIASSSSADRSTIDKAEIVPSSVFGGGLQHMLVALASMMSLIDPSFFQTK